MKRLSRFSRVLIVVCAVVLASVPALARTWYITADGTGDAPTIQAAIDSTSPGDTILVAAGTYTWTNQNTDSEYAMIHFIREKTDIFLHSESGAPATILNAQKQGRVMFIAGMNNLEIVGFTITGGKAPLLGYQSGGGIGAHISYDLLKDCVIRGNSAQFGGGLWCGGVSSMRIENCKFFNNTATLGGAMYFINSYNSPDIRDCVIRDNIATNHGGAMYVNNNLMHIENTIIALNEAASDGGAIRFQSCDMATLVGCTISENEATTGGGIALINSKVTVERSIVSYALGGGAFSLDAISTLNVGCTNIFANGNNTLPPGSVDMGGNFSLNPSFCGGFGTLIYTIDGASPCAPGNHPDGESCDLIGARGVDCTVPVESRSWGSIKARYNTR